MPVQIKNPVPTQAIQRNLKAAAAGEVVVGWPDSARHGGKPIHAIALQHEFGLNVPARPFIRKALGDSEAAVLKIASTLNAKILAGADADTNQALNQIGAVQAGAIKESIQAVTAPPLAEGTVRARLRRFQEFRGGKNKSKLESEADDAISSGGAIAKPLIDTGEMLKTVTWLVIQK